MILFDKLIARTLLYWPSSTVLSDFGANAIQIRTEFSLIKMSERQSSAGPLAFA